MKINRSLERIIIFCLSIKQVSLFEQFLELSKKVLNQLKIEEQYVRWSQKDKTFFAELGNTYVLSYEEHKNQAEIHLFLSVEHAQQFATEKDDIRPFKGNAAECTLVKRIENINEISQALIDAHLTDLKKKYAEIVHTNLHKIRENSGTTIHQLFKNLSTHKSLEALIDDYYTKFTAVDLVENETELQENLEAFLAYKNSTNSEERVFYKKRVQNGASYVVQIINDQLEFAPSRTIGYKNTCRLKYEPFIVNGIDGGVTNARLAAMIGQQEENKTLDQALKLFLEKQGIQKSVDDRKRPLRYFMNEDLAKQIKDFMEKQSRPLPFLQQLAKELIGKLGEDHELVKNHRWNYTKATHFCWISAFPVKTNPAYPKIEALHYELRIANKKLLLELHPEKSSSNKVFFEPFIQGLRTLKDYKISSWKVGNNHQKSLKFHRLELIERLDHFDKTRAPTNEEIEFAFNKLNKIYTDVNDRLLQFYHSNTHYMRNVKQEFVQWLIAKPESNYFNNNAAALSSALDRYNDYFEINLFEVSKDNYQSIIDSIREIGYEDKNSLFFLNSKGESNHLPRAILGDNNYIKFLNETFVGADQSPEHPPVLNQILYGPPGTGKTYSTLIKTISILDNKSEAILQTKSREKLKKRFEELVKEKRIVFSTFHQSMSYEDFVEGIKPALEEESENISYTIESGIFKEIATNAAFSIYKTSIENNDPHEIIFSVAFDVLVNQLQSDFEQNGTASIRSKSDTDLLFDGISSQGNILIKHFPDGENYTVSKSRLEKLHEGIGPLDDVSNIHKEFGEVIGGSNSSVYWAALNAVRAIINEGRIENEPTKTKFSLKEKVEQISKLSLADFKGKTGEPYVLIIDEINRGNVSQIFGELITLLEPDKRAGNKEALKITLPYSKKSFLVPNNLYLIGTMNTADRSVEALDSALRRRFYFEEMMPDYSVIEKELGDNSTYGKHTISRILKAINDRIEVLIDRDHTIGHSYFLKLHNLIGDQFEHALKSIFKDQIIPLLQEYFFNDYGKIQLVLGKGFVEKESVNKNIFPDIKDTEIDLEGYTSKSQYKIKPIDEHFKLAEAIELLMESVPSE